MSTNNSSTYPPPSTFAGPTQYAGGSHEQYPGPSQGYPPPESRNARNNSGFMSPPNVPRPHPSSSLSAHDHPLYHQPTHGPVGNPTIRMPQVQATPSYASSALPLTDETSGEIMYMADPLNNIQPAPVPSLNYPLQAPVLSYPPSQHRGPGGVSGNVHISPHVQGYQNDFNDGRHPSGQGTTPAHRADIRPRGPPGCGVAGIKHGDAHNSQPSSQPKPKCFGLCGGSGS